MREISSPLDGFLSPFGRLLSSTAVIDPYSILGYKPPLVLDYENSKFRVSGSTSTAPSVVTATRTGLATQLDASGNLVWNAHNLALNSATPATQNITVVSGADYTVECTGSGSITLSGAGTGSVTEGNPVEITASTTTLTLTVVGSLDTMWAYRSDLGGMAPVPLTRRVAGSTTYVPTTSAAVYLPREEAYTYVSGSLVGPYYQKESDARTNLADYWNSPASQEGGWAQDADRLTLTPNVETGIDGQTSLDKIDKTSSTGDGYPYFSYTSAATTDLCATFYVLKDSNESRFPEFSVYDYTSASGKFWMFNTKTGATALRATAGTPINNDITVLDQGLFWKIVITLQSGVSASNNIHVILRPAAGTVFGTFSATATGFIYAGFLTLTEGLVSGSDIPTSGSTVTRSADSTTISAGNMPAYTDALSFQMEGLMTGESSTFADWTLDASNGIQITSGASDFTFTQEAAGVVDSVTGGSYTSGVNTPFNFASTHASTLVAAAVDGTSLTPDTTPTTLPDLSATTFDLAPTFNGFVKLFRVWSANITAAGREEAST